MRVLIPCFGTHGDLNPYIALSRELLARGHSPTIVTHGVYRPEVEAWGIGFRAARPDAPEYQELFPAAMDPRRGPEVVIREILVPRIRDSYEDTMEAAVDTDLVVTHPVAFAGPIVAEERGLPWVSTVLSPLSFFSVHDLPVFPQAPWAKRVARLPGAARLMVRAIRALTRPWVEPVERLRAERGLPSRGHPLFEGQHSPRGVLALFSRVLARPRPDWPRLVSLTGFPFHNPAAEDAAEAARLEAFLSAGPPPVVFTLGTSAVQVAGEFYEESLAAARRLGLRAALLIGAGHPLAGLAEDDAIAVERAPHDALFPRAAGIVHHGGIGTLGQALRAGRPMLVVPHAHDQPDNAWRARRLGVARVLGPGRYHAGRVARELGELRRPEYAERAEAVGRIVREERGAVAACDRIEAVAAGLG
jgi:UDP:flavonoid glycosyltransferase YjiC (YdhE family)